MSARRGPRARLRLLRERSDDLLPAAVLAESVLTGHVGHDYHVQRLFDVMNIADVDASTGHAAGALRREAMAAEMTPPPSGVDTIVAAIADSGDRGLQAALRGPFALVTGSHRG